MNAGHRTLPVLVRLHKSETFTAPGTRHPGFGRRRRCCQPAHQRSPSRRAGQRQRVVLLVLDGTLIVTGRVRAIQAHHPAKTPPPRDEHPSSRRSGECAIVWMSERYPQPHHRLTATPLLGVLRELHRPSSRRTSGDQPEARQRQANRSHTRLQDPTETQIPSSRAGVSRASPVGSPHNTDPPSRPAPSSTTTRPLNEKSERQDHHTAPGT